MIDKFLNWLAASPSATALKVGVSAGFVWLLDNITTLNLGPTETAIVIAALTILINALNPKDTRYGKGKI